MRLAGLFDQATRALDTMGEVPVAAAATPVIPIEDLIASETELPIVPIEVLLYEEAPSVAEPAAPAPVAAAQLTAEADGWDIAASYSRYEALAGGPAAAPDAPPVPEPATPLPLVEISELLFRGPSALAEADRLRIRIRSAVAAGRPATETQPLVEELLDLVELAAAG
jgi:hypothetical protein